MSLLTLYSLLWFLLVSDLTIWSNYFKRLSFLAVVSGPGSATRACDYGARETRQCTSHLPPGSYALPTSLFLGQEWRQDAFSLMKSKKKKICWPWDFFLLFWYFYWPHHRKCHQLSLLINLMHHYWVKVVIINTLYILYSKIHYIFSYVFSCSIVYLIFFDLIKLIAL